MNKKTKRTKRNYSEITDQIRELLQICISETQIDPEAYNRYDVKRGLRDIDGRGVLTGLTNIGDISARKIVDGKSVPSEGKLFYRGINVEQLVKGCVAENRFGFEETIYLLLFGSLPTANQMAEFSQLLGDYRSLPSKFVRDVIMKAPSPDMMNALARSVLTLYAYDNVPDDISPENVLRQCLQLISMMPLLAVYGYCAFAHYHRGESLYIHVPDPGKSIAENILHLLRPDSVYTPLEARVLDICLILHAEHGGGNNSSFTTRVVTSTGTDTYSAIAAALGSLKGPRHGGANIKVSHMMDDLKNNVSDWTNEASVRDYLVRLLDKQAFEGKGLIYGMGHAVYSVSDPRSVILHDFAESLSAEKGMQEEYQLYDLVSRLAPEVICEKRRIYKGVSANVDFFSGFVYRMLRIPTALFTPIFAISRMSGWSAHRMEELLSGERIIRPAYQSVSKMQEYIPMSERK